MLLRLRLPPFNRPCAMRFESTSKAHAEVPQNVIVIHEDLSALMIAWYDLTCRVFRLVESSWLCRGSSWWLREGVQSLAGEVVGLEEARLQARSRELKLQQQLAAEQEAGRRAASTHHNLQLDAATLRAMVTTLQVLPL